MENYSWELHQRMEGEIARFYERTALFVRKGLNMSAGWMIGDLVSLACTTRDFGEARRIRYSEFALQREGRLVPFQETLLPENVSKDQFIEYAEAEFSRCTLTIDAIQWLLLTQLLLSDLGPSPSLVVALQRAGRDKEASRPVDWRADDHDRLNRWAA